MKPIHLLSTVLLLISNWSHSQISAKQIPAQQPVPITAPFLLKTNWDQWGIYAKYTPENQVLGCWSTALAQIFYYHHLKPSGRFPIAVPKDTLLKMSYRIILRNGIILQQISMIKASLKR